MIVEELKLRHSVRSFEEGPLDEKTKNALNAIVSDINAHGIGMHFQLVYNDSDPFRGFLRSYGAFRNARNYLAAVVDTNFPNHLEMAGYHAERFAIEAIQKGIGTCFVGGTYSSSHVNARIRVGETLPFIMVFGRPEEEKTGVIARQMAKMVHRKSLAPRDFYVDRAGVSLQQALERMPQLQEGLEALACAPSSLNRQPVRVSMDPDGTVRAFLLKPAEKDTIDLGIAKYNFQAVVPGFFEFGNDAPFLSE